MDSSGNSEHDVRPGRSGVSPGALGVLLALVLAGSPAQAQEGLEQARACYFEANFEAAIAAFSAVLQGETLDREAAAEAHLYLAALRFMAGDAASAREHAEAAVALDPAVTAPEGASPEFDGLLDQVRAELGGEPAALHIEAGEPGLVQGREGEVAARLEPAPPLLSPSLRLRCGIDGIWVVEGAGPPPRVAVRLAPGQEVTSVQCQARADTEAGVPLVQAAVELPVEAPAMDSLPPGEQQPARRQQARRRRAWPWIAGTGGAMVLFGVIVAVAVAAARNDEATATIGAPQVEGW